MEGRTMRRAFAIAIAVLLLTVGTFATPAQAEEPCANITGDSTQSYYVVDGPGNTPDHAILSIRVTTGEDPPGPPEPLCEDATLTVYVSTDGITFSPYVYPGDPHFGSCGEGCVTFTYDYGSTAKKKTSTAPATVYVYLETAQDSTVQDRAPDVGAPPFVLCDFDPKHKNYDDTGTVIPPCTPPGGNYFQ
jgi:hypothetical protein